MDCWRDCLKLPNGAGSRDLVICALFYNEPIVLNSIFVFNEEDTVRDCI